MIRFSSLWLAILVVVITTGVPGARANDKTELPTSIDGRRIFRCLVAVGEFQEVSVYSMSNGTFKMTTLSNVGSRQAYDMPSTEWSVGRLKVPCTHDEKVTCGEISINGHAGSYDFGASIGDCQ